MLAKFIGTSVLADLFYIALRLPMILRTSVTDETFNSAYIPIYGEKTTESRDRFALSVFGLLLFIFTPLVIIAEIFMPNIIRIIAPGIVGIENINLLIESSRIIFPYLLITILSSVFIGILNSENKFGLSSFLPTIINLTLIFSILVFPIIEGEKIFLLSCSVILGGLIQLIVLLTFVESKFWKKISNPLKIFREVKIFIKLISPTFASSSLQQINLIIGIILASYVSGGMSYLYYAQRIYWLPLTLIGISIGSVLLTKLSRSLNSKKEDDARASQDEAYKYCISLIVPLTFFMIFISNEIVSLLFERGEFDSSSSKQTTNALKVFLLGLPAACLVKILTPAFYAKKTPLIPLKVNAICLILNIIITLILYRYLGFIAIPLALSTTAWINLFLLITEHRNNISFSLPNGSLKYAMRYLILSSVMILIIFLLDIVFLQNLQPLFESISKMIIFTALYIGFVYKYDSEIFNSLKPKWSFL